MEDVLTPVQMRTADDATIASGTPGVELMERASHACAVVALRMLGGAYGRRVVVVAGKGNNGGDGIACARHLASSGVTALVVLLAEPTGDSAYHLEFARKIAPRGRLRIEPWDPAAFDRAVRRADLIVDSVFGTGLSDAPRGNAAVAIEAINSAPTPVLAVDIPSGVSGADGSMPGSAVAANVTVAIQSLKIGHVVSPGAFRCGRVDVADIGIAVEDGNVFVPEAADVRAVLPALDPDTHKYRVGALGVLAGSAGMTGAAILTAAGAIRSGAGLVILGVPASTMGVIEGAVTEAVKIPLPEVEGRLDAKGVDEMGDRLDRCRALALGPGLGRGPQAVALVSRALDVDLPLVVDGDGLWALGEILREEPDALDARREATLLTPHSGEFGYLTGRPVSDDRVADVRDAAQRWGAVVHLKGRRALTADPSGDVWVNTSGNPGAATGGTGDVLTGIVGSLLAQGVSSPAAMWAGAYLHGAAADVVAARLGQRPLAARDLPEALPSALHQVGRAVRSSDNLRTVLEAAH